MVLRRSPHCLTLYIDPLGFRIVAGFTIGLGILILFSLRLKDLAPLLPAVLMILGGLVCLQQWGGSTIIYFDRQRDLISVHHQKLLGAKTESFDISLRDVVDLYVEKNSHAFYEERLIGGSERVISHFFYLLIKVREGYSLPLTRCGTSGKNVEQKYEAIAQEVRQFLNL